jgi:hypothetical protein
MVDWELEVWDLCYRSGACQRCGEAVPLGVQCPHLAGSHILLVFYKLLLFGSPVSFDLLCSLRSGILELLHSVCARGGHSGQRLITLRLRRLSEYTYTVSPSELPWKPPSLLRATSGYLGIGKRPAT